MREQGQSPNDPGGGTVTLNVSMAHLETIHGAIGHVDSTVMFYIGLNFVGLGILVGALSPLGWPFWAAIAPGVLTLSVFVLGAWALQPRDVEQFPSPSDGAAFEGEGYSDDQLAWTYVGSIAQAAKQANRINTLKVRAAYVMLGLTFLHIVAVFASAAALST